MEIINPSENDFEKHKLRVNKIISRTLYEMEQARTHPHKKNYTPNNIFICMSCYQKTEISDKHSVERLSKSNIWYKILLCGKCLDKSKLKGNIRMR